MKFLLIFLVLVHIFGKVTKNEEDLDPISEYASNVHGRVMFEHGGKGRFVIYTAQHYFIGDTQTLANQLCDLLPIPCIVSLIANETYFMGAEIPEIILTTALNQTQLHVKLQNSWVPSKSLLVTTSEGIAETILFIVDSGASITYLSYKEKVRLNINDKDCKFWIPISGIVKSSETLCVVEIVITLKGKEYPTFAQLGNSKTTDISLLGRFKLFDYFKICFLKNKQKIEFFQDVSQSEETKIKRDEL